MTHVPDSEPSEIDGASEGRATRVGRRQSLLLVILGASASLLNGLFSIVFLRLSGVVHYAELSPLLAFSSVASASSNGIEYALTAEIARTMTLERVPRVTASIFASLIPLLALTPLLQHELGYQSIVPLVLAALLFVVTFAQAVPNAVLLAFGSLWTLGIVAIGEALIRLAVFIPLAHRQPVYSGMAISIGVTFVGGALMLVLAFRKGPQRELPSRLLPPTNDRKLVKTSVGLLFYLPYTLPVWLAKAGLPLAVVPRVSVSCLLVSGSLLLVAPVTSAAIPFAVRQDGTRTVRHAQRIAFGLSALGSIALVFVGPRAISLIAPHSVGNLLGQLVPFAFAAPFWAIFMFSAWIHMTRGASGRTYLVALLCGVVAQCALGSTSDAFAGVAWGPAVNLAVTFTVLLFAMVRASLIRRLQRH